MAGKAARIVIAEFMDDDAVASLAREHDTHYDPHLAERTEALAAAVAEAEALIVRNRTQVNRALLEAAPKLRVVGRLGVGLDNIDVAACGERKIAVIPATGANALAVAEYVVAMALLLLRGTYAATAEVGGGQWPRAALSDGREASGKTLGIVGFGSIGRLAAKLAHRMGMGVAAHDPALPARAEAWSDVDARCASLDELLRISDVVTLHVPLTDAARHLIDAKRLAAMKRGAVLINTARGGVVDEEALAAALRSGALGGAALDVFEREPLPAGSALAGCPNLILTPHIAGVTRESNVRVSAMIAERVAAFLAAR